MTTRWLPAALAALLMTGVALATPQDAPKPTPKADAASDEQLKETALKLNSLTSEDATKAKLRELFKDKDAAKKLVAVAAKVLKDAGEKDPPFKYNAGIVLGNLAILVKDWPAAEAFYTFCYANAEKLQSGKKMLDCHKTLVDILNEQKKFDKAEELTKRVLDGGGKEVEDAQLSYMEKLIQTLAKGGNTGKYSLEIHRWNILSTEGPAKTPRKWPMRVMRFKTAKIDTGWKVIPASDWNAE